MKKLLTAIFVIAIAIAPQAFADMHQKNHDKMMDKAPMAKEMNTPMTTLVAYHADWCGGCKILGPKMKKVMDSMDETSKTQIQMVKFDFTNDSTKAITQKMAAEKGLSALYPKEVKTGQIKVIDSATGDVLAKIHYKMSEEEITGALKAVLNRS